MSRPKLSRRTFLGTGAGAAVGALVGRRTARAEQPTDATRPGRVVLVRDPEAVGEAGAVDGEIVHSMLNRAVAALFQEEDHRAAWRRVIRADDVVGIKSNEWRRLPTPAALEDAIRSEVLSVGVDPDDLAVEDRGVRRHPVFDRATSLINVRPMRSHHWAGLGTCLKNLIPFVPRPWDYHGDACSSLGAIWKLSRLEGKVRLNILVMLTPQFHGVGPHSFSPEHVWPYRGLIVGTDPVAVDATGARIIAAQRELHFGEPKPISPPPHHIERADSVYGLGVSDPDRIDVIRLGWREGELI